MGSREIKPEPSANASAVGTAKLIQAGEARTEELGSALRSIQTSLATDLAGGMSSVLEAFRTQNDLYIKALNKYNESLDAALDLDAVPREELAAFIDKTQTKQIQLLDLYRKVVQGSPLFDTETISNDERLVLRLFRSFSCEAEKQEFLKICKERLAKFSDE